MSTGMKLRQASSINVPDRRFWGTSKGIKPSYKATELSSIYSFSIWDLEKNEIADASPYRLDPANRTNWAWFQFPTPPSQYEITEPSATTITPTQDGGMFVESHGSVFKDIRISGTVGLRPNVPTSEVFSGLQASTGVSIQYPSTLQTLSNDERGLNPKEATGFDDIIFLRNLFRFYLDTKKDPDLARKTALVWIYAKESEAYVVEPINFVTNRDAGNPLGWTYTIQLRTLVQLKGTWTVVPDSMNIFQAYNKSMEMFNRLALDISRALNSLADQINFVSRLPFSAVDNIMGWGIEIMSGMASIKNSLKFNKLQEGYVRRWNTKLREANQLLAETGSSNSGAGQTGNAGQARKSTRDMWRYSNMLLCLDFLWQEDKNVAVSDYSSAYRDEIGNAPITTGSPLNVANITIPGAAKEEKILGGEDIRAIARRLTGDEANWKKLVILNNLRSPYIASERSDGVLGYGDYILVPKRASAKDDSTQVPRQLDEDAAFQQLPKLRRRYGRDIRLQDSQANAGLADLMVNQRGDLMTVEDEENVYQAVMIKLSTEQGELPTHPTFGAKYPIGSKFPTLSRLQEFSLNAQSTFLQDPRVRDVSEIKTYVNGDQLLFSAKLQLIASDAKLPVTFSVRR
jgi:hypothetical protein